MSMSPLLTVFILVLIWRFKPKFFWQAIAVYFMALALYVVYLYITFVPQYTYEDLVRDRNLTLTEGPDSQLYAENATHYYAFLGPRYFKISKSQAANCDGFEPHDPWSWCSTAPMTEFGECYPDRDIESCSGTVLLPGRDF